MYDDDLTQKIFDKFCKLFKLLIYLQFQQNNFITLFNQFDTCYEFLEIKNEELGSQNHLQNQAQPDNIQQNKNLIENEFKVNQDKNQPDNILNQELVGESLQSSKDEQNQQKKQIIQQVQKQIDEIKQKEINKQNIIQNKNNNVKEIKQNDKNEITKDKQNLEQQQIPQQNNKIKDDKNQGEKQENKFIFLKLEPWKNKDYAILKLRNEIKLKSNYLKIQNLKNFLKQQSLKKQEQLGFVDIIKEKATNENINLYMYGNLITDDKMLVEDLQLKWQNQYGQKDRMIIKYELKFKKVDQDE
ncbi:hypothetical protein PPERSA_11635 [Pseudocohnilembus persalinus]|uniref:Uncharacterized protein n=1 Tax=Pseudocohnilembus persalinus TaxID=266149 RepID=A0A0V0QA48_PSEPJ|nr:hypothetical protein PPERSA_11635 [Pseudocohnilembus persalinus]|eukprot:KRW99034.1 hypothetical protein PPERSA_11635 [Pseudocohnilembus persalinus]